VIAGLYSVVIGIWGFDPIVDKELLAIGSLGLHSNGGLFSDPVMMAQCFGLMIFWFIGPAYYYARFREPKFWLLIPAIMVMVATLFLSQNVWICFSSIIALAIISLCFNFRIGLLILFIIGIIFGMVVAIFPNFIFSAFSSNDFVHLSENLAAMKSEIAMIADHPLVGFGYGNGQGVQTQNQYLLFFSTTGIVGGFCYFVILALFARLNIKTWLEIPDKDLFQKGLALGLLGSQIVFILGGFESTIFENWIPKYIIITVWALVVWLAYEYRVLRERI
jgi:O-antigen ligase